MDWRSIRQGNLVSFFVSVTIGLLGFLYFADLNYLNVRNVSWLFLGPNSDETSAYLGWEFFRRSEWSIPLGQNRDFGLLPGTSITYSDSLPLFAIVSKVFKSLIVGEFQYFGIWLLLCFIFQSVFAARIIRLFRKNLYFEVFSSTLAVSTPFFLQRIPIHLALSGHFLILAAIYLILKFRKQFKILPWLLLTHVSILTHPYLFAMVAVICIAQIIDSANVSQGVWRKSISQVSLFVLTWALNITLILGVTVGVPNGTATNYYGVHPWNLLSIFNARDWPKVLDFVPARDSGFDTFSYPGIGILLLFFLSTLICFDKPSYVFGVIRRQKGLVFASIGLLIFAITNRIGIGSKKLVLFENDFMENLFSIFRASARMAWPFLYLLTFFGIFLITSINRTKIQRTLMGLILVAQLMDVREAPQFLFPDKYEPQNRVSHYINDEWLRIPQGYHRILVLQDLRGDLRGWPEMAIIANYYGMATNSAYLARYNKADFDLLNSSILRAIETRNFERKTIYVVYRESGIKLQSSSNSDVIWELANKTILFPDWNRKIAQS